MFYRNAGGKGYYLRVQRLRGIIRVTSAAVAGRIMSKESKGGQSRNKSKAAVAASKALAEWDDVINFIHHAEGPDGARFSQADNISGTNITITDLDKRIRSILELVTGVVEPKPWSPIPELLPDRWTVSGQI